MTLFLHNISTSYSKKGFHVPSTANPAFKILKRIIICLLLIVVGSTTYGQITVSPKDAGTGANVTGIGTVAWTNPGYIATGSTTDYAQVTPNNNASNYLMGNNYGFSIPSNAVIQGIQVTIGKLRESGNGNIIYDNVVSLVKNEFSSQKTGILSPD